MIKCILFDMDGVLIDARDWHYDALNRALLVFGYNISLESHLTTFDGLPTRKKLKMLSESYGLPLMLHEFINELKQAFTLQISYQKCKPTFNHQYALSRLHAEGYKMGVCSNSVRQSVESMMRLSNLEKYLDVLVSNEDVKKSKPDPEMYLKAMKQLECKPSECLILEDNENGIKAAKSSGANLLKVSEPNDVDYFSIKEAISKLN
jgi:beta-phosphoglucomutase